MKKFTFQKKHGFWMLVTLTFATILLLTCLTPLIGDDYSYGAGENSLAEIFNMEVTQYFTWNGRSLAHLTARLFLALPKVLFNICNALVYTALTLMIYRLAGPAQKYSIPLYVLISAGLFLFLPMFGQSNLWLIGSCNYLWGTANIMLLLLFYHRYIVEHAPIKRQWLAALGMFLLGVTAGWRNENTSGGAVLAVVAYIVFARLKKQPLRPWMFSGLFGAAGGLALMVLAPGNAFRLQQEFGHEAYRPFYTGYLLKLDEVTGYITGNLMLPLMLLAVLTAVLWVTQKKWEKLYFPLLSFLLFLAVAYVLVLLGGGEIAPRAYHGAACFLVLAMAQSFAGISGETKPLQALCLSSALMLAAQALFAFFPAFSGNVLLRAKYSERHRYVTAQMAAGNLNPVVPRVESNNPHNGYIALNGLGDLESYKSYWVNSEFARYYGLESVRSTSHDEWQNIYENGDPALMNCYDAGDYAALLQSGDYLVAVTAGVDSAGLLDESLAGMLSQLGFAVDENLPAGGGFVGVWQGGAPLVQQHGEGVVVYSDNFSGVDIRLVADASGKNELYSDICIGNTEYARNTPGVNLVVISTAHALVVDSVSFYAENGVVVGHR